MTVFVVFIFVNVSTASVIFGQQDCVFSKRPDMDQQACAGCAEATGVLCVRLNGIH